MFDNIPEKSKEWLDKQAMNYEIPEEELYKKFIECEQELREIGLRKESEDSDDGLEDFEYYEFIETQVNAYIISIQGTPTEELEVFIIGMYKARTLQTGKVNMDLVGWCVNPKNPTSAEPCRITAWEDQIQKCLTVKQFGCYRTKFGIDLKEKKKGEFSLNVTPATSFENECESFKWLGLGKEASFKTKAKLVFAQYGDPIPLARINEPKSQSALTEATNGKSYTNPCDMKIVKGNVTRINIDPQGEWATIGLVDKSFIPNGKSKDVAIWLNPTLASEFEFGEGSIVEILGTIARNKQGIASITACCVVPKMVVPPTSAKSKIKTASVENNVIENKPKKLNLSLTGEDED